MGSEGMRPVDIVLEYVKKETEADRRKVIEKYYDIDQCYVNYGIFLGEDGSNSIDEPQFYMSPSEIRKTMDEVYMICEDLKDKYAALIHEIRKEDPEDLSEEEIEDLKNYIEP